MEKDTLKAIEIINEILGDITMHLSGITVLTAFEFHNYIESRREDLFKIINDNKENQDE